jgi:hypothetical protein
MCITVCSLLTFNAGKLDESQYLLSEPRPERKYKDVVKLPWPLQEETGSQVPTAPTPVAQLIAELEPPASVKRTRNTARKEWDSIIQRRVLPWLGRGIADDVLRQQGSLSPRPVNASPGWQKRSPPMQKQIFLPAESPQPTVGLPVPDTSSPRRVSAIRLPAENEAAALVTPGAVTGKRREKPKRLGCIDRTNSFEPARFPPKYKVWKNEGPGRLTSEIFTGKRVRTIGEANCAALRQEMERAGAVLIDGTGAKVDFYVVRLAGCAQLCLLALASVFLLTAACSGAELVEKEVPEEEHHKARTECWVEWCIFESRICEVDENVTFRPLRVSTPLAGTASGVG